MIDVGVADTGDNLSFLRVGKVVVADKHPNADKLQLCQVDVGEGEPRQIVCGAWNFGVGATVAVGLPGVLLPGFPAPLDERPLRGELSRGMILAEDEIGLGSDHAGIMLLPGRDRAGDAARRRAAGPRAGARRDADDEPRRPALDGRPRPRGGDALRRRADPDRRRRPADPASAVGRGRRSRAPRRARATSRACSRTSPSGRRRCGCARGSTPPGCARSRTSSTSRTTSCTSTGARCTRSTASALAGGRIVVRHARAGEEVQTLDGTVRRVDERDLLITDGEKPVALAAIMGGANSEVVETTTEVLLEAANFEPIGVLKTSERLGLRTEGSNRWEKGVDPYLAEPAAVLASRLIVDLAGRRAGRQRRRARRPARAARRPAPARAHRPARRARGRPPPSSARSSSGSASRSTTTWDVTVPTVARARRHARDRPDRGGRAGRARPRAAHDAAAPLGRRPPDAASSGCGGSSRTCSSAPGSARPTPGASSPPIPTRLRSACPIR